MYSCGHMKQKHLLHQQSDVVLFASGNTDRYGISSGFIRSPGWTEPSDYCCCLQLLVLAVRSVQPASILKIRTCYDYGNKIIPHQTTISYSYFSHGFRKRDVRQTMRQSPVFTILQLHPAPSRTSISHFFGSNSSSVTSHWRILTWFISQSAP